MDKQSDDKGQSANAYSIRNSELNGALGAQEVAGVVIEHSNENNELVFFAHNPRLLEQFRGKQVEIFIRVRP